MITGRWGKPSEVLLDLVVESDGTVRGVANPGRQNAQIQRGHFDAASGAVHLDGEYAKPGAPPAPFHIEGHLKGRTLHLSYQFGDMRGTIEVVRVEEYTPRPVTFVDRVKRRLADLKRWVNARSRPTGEQNARALQVRGEPLDSIIFRDAVAADIPALAELHVTTWNATYNTTRGPTIATRAGQWNQVFAKENRRDFVLVLEDRNGRLIGFTWGKPDEGAFAHVTIAPCGGAFCRTITRAFKDQAEYQSPNVGRQIVIDMAPQGGGNYAGKVWRPANDKIYNGKASVQGDRMSLSGCVAGGLICKSQTWARVQ